MSGTNFEAQLKKRPGRPYNPGMGETGSKVRARRNELGLTLEEVADKVGISAAALSQFELGKTHTLKLPTAIGLAKVLGMEIEHLQAVPS